MLHFNSLKPGNKAGNCLNIGSQNGLVKPEPVMIYCPLEPSEQILSGH